MLPTLQNLKSTHITKRKIISTISLFLLIIRAYNIYIDITIVEFPLRTVTVSARWGDFVRALHITHSTCTCAWSGGKRLVYLLVFKWIWKIMFGSLVHMHFAGGKGMPMPYMDYQWIRCFCMSETTFHASFSAFIDSVRNMNCTSERKWLLWKTQMNLPIGQARRLVHSCRTIARMKNLRWGILGSRTL